MDPSKRASSSLMDDTRPQLEVPVEWCGGRDEGQDVRIRLVQSSVNEEVPRRNAVLALVFVHSDRLINCIKFFQSIGKRFEENLRPNFHEVTLNVDGDDVQPYIDCLSIMYDPPARRRSKKYYPSQTGIEGIKYTLKLLGVACHIDYLGLKLSITSYLISIQWSNEENLLVLRKTQMRKEGLRYFIKRCCHFLNGTAKDLIVKLLTTARVEGWRPFEQEVVAMVHEVLNNLLVEAHTKCDGKDSMDGMFTLPAKLRDICQILNALMEAQVATEGVKCLLQYPSIPKFLSSIRRSNEEIVVAVVGAFKTTTMSIYQEAVAGNVILGNLDRYTLLKNWTNFLEGYESHETRRGLDPQYKRAKEAIFDSLCGQHKIELEHMTAEYGYYFIFGKAEKLLKALNNSMG